MSIDKAITGGTIMIEDAVKHTGYSDINFAPSRRCKVELIFAVPEGESGKAYMEGVTRVAQTKLEEMLKKTPAVAGAEAPKTPAAEDPKPETAAAKKKRLAAEAEANKPPEKTKADLEREAIARASGGAKTDDDLLEEGTLETSKAVAKEDDLEDLLGEAAPPPITDLELGKAAQDKNAKMKAELGEKWAPAKIRELIAKASGGKRINDIPVAARAQFLKDLDAIK